MNATIPAVKASKSASPALDWSKVANARLVQGWQDHASPKQRKNESDEDFRARFQRFEDRLVKSAESLRKVAADSGASEEQEQIVLNRALTGRAVPTVVIGKRFSVPAGGKLGKALALLAVGAK